MSWQEELRRLDADLAAGRISLREHRKQREELLAAASGGVAPSPFTSPRMPAAQEAVPAWPTAEPVPEPPAPPAPAPAAAPASQGRSAALLESSVPTSAPSPADHRPTDSMRYPPIHEAPTVITPAIPHGTLPSLVPLSPPRDEVPPLPTRPERPDRRKPTWLFLALGVFLVLVLIGGATWFLGNRETSNTTAGGTTAAAPQTSSAVPVEQRVPALPGTPDPNNSTVSVDKGVELGLYPVEAADVYKRNGVSEIVYRASSEGDEQYFLLVIHAGSASQAQAVTNYMRGGALSSGYTVLPADPSVATGTKSGRTMNGTWYSSGDVSVVLWVSQPAGRAEDQLRQHLDQERSELRAALPPS
ncbi:hypothetical protein FHX82_000334 [Amycolatopsis bartoniae]|uniref:Uncharacterized protein n=1 Tax=Amycolatopsis bartoniae TaxID=941986 RepID=A0A8H9IVG2_9PSEU|nr:hypothetical protein [Amycolatopsis bartoniae]MBB2933314.1 hypothetical protein [Amycolatopsis bartoniae]TVT08078.1 hypothetical protein FNH07_13970 [Amycolatopsis bartoniae]GHF58631.1 hypothetical protein GCM10017566_34980 [Amycolatopsis bartoniae]